MKKRITSILLVMVIILTMTACVSDTHTLAFEQTESTTVTTVEVVTETAISTEVNSTLKVKPLIRKDIEKMSSLEISNLFFELVEFSKEKDLSSQDMDQIGYNFYIIWRSIDFTLNQQSEFETKSYEAFKNVYTMAIEKEISLENISTWTSVPVTEVLLKYFSSNNFFDTYNVYCTGFYSLQGEDIDKVAKVIFKNPLFEINSYLACTVLKTDCSDMTTFLAWEHLINLSQSSNPKISEIPRFTHSTCGNLYCFELYNNSEKFLEVAQNIMKNSSYDFVEKYSIFINCLADMDINYISNIAFDSLVEISKNADESTLKMIRQIVDNLHNDDIANELIRVLEEFP